VNTTWQSRIDRPGASAVPILVANMHHIFWVPPRYKTVATATFDGKPFTVRSMAQRTGYSTMGLHAALKQMSRLGLGALSASKGCLGRTRFRLQRDVSVANVRIADTVLSLDRQDVAVVSTFPEPDPGRRRGD